MSDNQYKLPSDTFCILPWIHLSTRPDGSMRVCCTANASSVGATNDKEHGGRVGIVKTEDGKPANLNNSYPNGKAGAMRLAIGEEDITPKDFPASALRQCAVWILDEPNGSELGMGVSTVEKAIGDV